LLADKAYDSGDFRSALEEQNCTAVIPSNGSRAEKLPYDKELFKARSEVECTFNLLKQARRFATRYEKTVRNYAAWSPLVARCSGSALEALSVTGLRQFDEHRDDPEEHLLTRLVPHIIDGLQSQADVQKSG